MCVARVYSTYMYFFSQIFFMPAHTISKPLIPLVFFLSSSFSQSIRAVRYNVCTAYKLLCSDNHSKQQINQLTEPNQSAPPILNRRDRQLALCFGQLFIFIVHFTTCYTLCLLIRNWCFRWHTDLSHLLLNIPYRTHCTLHTTYIHNFKLQCIFGHKNNLHWVNIQTKLLFNIHLLRKIAHVYGAWYSSTPSLYLSIYLCLSEKWIVLVQFFYCCYYKIRKLWVLSERWWLRVCVCVHIFLFTLSFTWRYLCMQFRCVFVFFFLVNFFFAHFSLSSFEWAAGSLVGERERERALHRSVNFIT